MEYALEEAAFAGIGEDDLAHFPAVEQIVVEYLAAKRFANFGEGGGARRDDLSRNHVGINDRYAKLCEESADGRFTAGNATSEPDAQRSVGCDVVD
jgi:hypothetical protein